MISQVDGVGYAVMLYHQGRYKATPLGPTTEVKALRFIARPPNPWTPLDDDEELIMVRVERAIL